MSSVRSATSAANQVPSHTGPGRRQGATDRKSCGRGALAGADAHGYQYMPAAPQTVALYLGHLAADGKSLATINQARAAISHAHAAQGIPKADNPARHPVVAKPSRAGGIRLQRPHR